MTDRSHDFSEFARVLRRLLDAADDPKWTGRDDALGMSMDIDAAIAGHDSRFRLVSLNYPVSGTQGDEDRMEFAELEWLEPTDHTLHALNEDVYALIGAFVEETLAVRSVVHDRTLTYEMYTGSDKHGHRVLLAISGPAVEDTIRGYKEVRRSLERDGR